MRKNFLILMLMALLPLASFAAPADNGTGANTKYTFDWDATTNPKSATITGFVTDGKQTNVVIPAKVSFPREEGAEPTEFNVTGIGNNAFLGETGIASISFEASSNLRTIGEGAFDGCTALASIDFANAQNLTTIGVNAFRGSVVTELDLEATKVAEINNLFGSKFTAPAVVCPLTTIKLPKTWTSIENNAFINCTNLTTLSLIPATQTGVAGQAIGNNAFEGAKITSIDFSKTTITQIPNTILVGEGVTENNVLETVKLNNIITNLHNAFEGFTALNSIDLQNDAALTTLNGSEFEGCSALTSINLTKVTTLGNRVFANSGLTTISFHKGIAAVPDYAFWECADLATVNFANDYETFNGIGQYAFAYTNIAAITVPKVLTDVDDAIESYAFQGCASLKDFTYAPTTLPANAPVNNSAFKRCSGVIFHTTQEYATAKPAPTNTTYDYVIPSDGVKFNTLNPNPVTAYKTNANKFYIKWVHADKNIMVKKSDAKVYDAYLDETDKTLNMIQYKVKGGYYIIPKTKAALILTDNNDLEYEETVEAGTSWLSLVGAPETALKINAAATTRAALESAVLDEDLQLFVWTNSATKGVGFGKYTGSNVPAGTLYTFAKPDETNASAPKIAWYDENGFSIESPIDNGTVTGIENIETVEKNYDGAIFNMAGQKVRADYKGVVIKNGKKVVIK